MAQINPTSSTIVLTTLCAFALTTPASALTAAQVAAIESANGDVGALALVASFLTRDTPSAAGEIAAAATAANPSGAARIAAAAAVSAPGFACDAAAAAASASPELAGQIAGAVGAISPSSAVGCAASIAEATPAAACEIVALTSAATGQSAQAVASAIRTQDPALVECASVPPTSEELAKIDEAVAQGQRDAREAAKPRSANVAVFESASELQEQGSPN